MSDDERAAILVRALQAAVAADTDTLRELLTDDVCMWAPTGTLSSLAEVLADVERRDDTFGDIVLDVSPLAVGGEMACAEWTATMTHRGPIELDDGTVVEPAGARVVQFGVTVAEFDGERICSVRQYTDQQALIDLLRTAD